MRWAVFSLRTRLGRSGSGTGAASISLPCDGLFSPAYRQAVAVEGTPGTNKPGGEDLPRGLARGSVGGQESPAAAGALVRGVGDTPPTVAVDFARAVDGEAVSTAPVQPPSARSGAAHVSTIRRTNPPGVGQNQRRDRSAQGSAHPSFKIRADCRFAAVLMQDPPGHREQVLSGPRGHERRHCSVLLSASSTEGPRRLRRAGTTTGTGGAPVTSMCLLAVLERRADLIEAAAHL